MGTIVAPLSHYTFMLASAPMGATHGSSDLSPVGHAHHGTDHASADGNRATLVAPHVVCDYASIFATFSATPTADASLVVIQVAVPLAPETRTDSPSADLILPFNLRAPPSLVA